MRLRTILIGTAALVVSFGGALVAMQVLWPVQQSTPRPTLTEVPPLPPATRVSVITAPTAIALTAIRDAMEARAPRDFSGKRDGDPIGKILSNADIGWTLARTPIAVTGRQEGLAVSTALNGSLRITGQIATQAAGGVGNVVGSILGQDLGRGVSNLAGRTVDQRVDLRGNVTITSRPAITSAWRLEPNLAANVAMADANLSVLGVRINTANEVKPLLERSVNEQVNALNGRLRNDPFLEAAARREWAKLCRSIALGAVGNGMPSLWLELKPTRAFAAQPRVDSNAVTLTVGVQAETRIVPSETKPNCPFPPYLELVPQADQGKLAIAVPIDVPFTEVNKLIEAQLKGRTFPEDKSGPYEATIQSAAVAPSGDRLLISLRVKATEKKSWFGFGGEANVHVWGKPVLDRERQMLRLTDVKLDLESEGVLGAAARAAVPYLESALADNAVLDLKPFAANAQRSIASALTDFRAAGDGVRVDAAVTGLRLADIAFDAKTLRVIAEADGTVRVAVSQLPSN
jgi:uncharacterized protein DUF4403